MAKDHQIRCEARPFVWSGDPSTGDLCRGAGGGAYRLLGIKTESRLGRFLVHGDGLKRLVEILGIVAGPYFLGLSTNRSCRSASVRLYLGLLGRHLHRLTYTLSGKITKVARMVLPNNSSSTATLVPFAMTGTAFAP